MNKKFLMIALGLLVVALIIGACLVEFDTLAGAFTDGFANADGEPVTGSGTGQSNTTFYPGGTITVDITLDEGVITVVEIDVDNETQIEPFASPARVASAGNIIKGGNIDVVDALGEATTTGKGIRQAAARALLRVGGNGPVDNLPAEWKNWAD